VEEGDGRRGSEELRKGDMLHGGRGGRVFCFLPPWSHTDREPDTPTPPQGSRVGENAVNFTLRSIWCQI
jgi:hypothetical protein